MKIKFLKLLCGSDEPLPTNLLRLLLIGCVFVFSSYAQAISSTDIAESVAYSGNAGSIMLLGFGVCSLLVVRRRKPWVAVPVKNLTHG